MGRHPLRVARVSWLGRAPGWRLVVGRMVGIRTRTPSAPRFPRRFGSWTWNSCLTGWAACRCACVSVCIRVRARVQACACVPPQHVKRARPTRVREGTAAPAGPAGKGGKNIRARWPQLLASALAHTSQPPTAGRTGRCQRQGGQPHHAVCHGGPSHAAPSPVPRPNSRYPLPPLHCPHQPPTAIFLADSKGTAVAVTHNRP